MKICRNCSISQISKREIWKIQESYSKNGFFKQYIIYSSPATLKMQLLLFYFYLLKMLLLLFKIYFYFLKRLLLLFQIYFYFFQMLLLLFGFYFYFLKRLHCPTLSGTILPNLKNIKNWPERNILKMCLNLVTQGPKKICASFLHEQKYPLIT